MGTRSYADVAPTPATIALNAYIFGYSGHSLVTPHAALKQLWWTDERIERKITRAFVVSKLRGEERQFLDRPLAFGEGLTDDTYMEWILDRAKRLFLILTEIGVPDQIFGCIDDSWDDDDLPIARDNVRNLELAYENDENLNRRFYNMQFLYLLRELKAGAHIDYGPKEHIPMEYVNTLPPAVSLQTWDRVHFPGNTEDIFMRRKYALTDKETGQSYREAFMRDVKKAQMLPHEHIADVWASYTSEDAGYVLSSFIGEHTLGTYIDHRTPMQLLRLPVSERPILLCEWMHCLADALASLHHRGFAHTAIRPSNILIDHGNHIAFADVGSIRTFQRGKKPRKTEAFDYAAPELQICRVPVVDTSSPPISSMSAFSKLRKMSGSTTSSSTSSPTGSSTRSNSMCTVATSPMTSPPRKRSNSLTRITAAISPSLLPRCSSSSVRNFSRHLNHEVCPSPTVPTSPRTITPVTILPLPSCVDSESLRDPPEPAPEMSDMYSLGCIFLDILTFMLRGKLNDFVKFRSTRVADHKNKLRTDTSFHCDPDRIDEWMAVLEEDSERRPEQIYRGVPELLRIIRGMMAQNPTFRPTAAQIRDRIQEILVAQCGVETLCCAGREWDAPNIADTAVTPSIRDSFSIRTGTLASSSRKGSDCPRSGSACGDHRSVFSRAETNTLRMASRRGSAASTATAKISAWRRALTRSP